MPPDVTYLDARNAYLVADELRFGGANQQELWSAWIKRGMGDKAAAARNVQNRCIASIFSGRRS